MKQLESKIRLIVLTDYAYVNGGASQVALSSLNLLAKAGIDVCLIAAVGPIDPNISLDKVRVICFDGLDLLGDRLKCRSAINGIWNYRYKKNLEHILDEYSPANTVIHVHTWVKALSSSVVNACVGKGFKIALTLHDYFSVCPNGGLYDYPKGMHCTVDPMSISCLVKNCDSRSYTHKLWRYGRHLVQNKIGKVPMGIKCFITVSSYSEALISPYLPKGVKIVRIPNPVGGEKLPNSQPSANKSFSYVGRFSPEKGAVLFAEAANSLKIASTFVGLGPEGANISRLCPSAILAGWLNSNGVSDVLKSSRALIFPSICHETQGLVVAESAAIGIPAIVSDGCAASELVNDGVTGLLFKSGNVVDLMKKIKILEDNPNIADDLGKNAYRDYWSLPSSLERHVESLIACYVDIIEENE